MPSIQPVMPQVNPTPQKVSFQGRKSDLSPAQTQFLSEAGLSSGKSGGGKGKKLLGALILAALAAGVAAKVVKPETAAKFKLGGAQQAVLKVVDPAIKFAKEIPAKIKAMLPGGGKAKETVEAAKETAQAFVAKA